MHDGTRVIAGECTTTFEGARRQEQRGDVVVVCKPDNTVLVHDADGYQPVAWLTRAEQVTIRDGILQARDGDQHLTVETHDQYDTATYPTSVAGAPVGDCPECPGTLVRADGGVRCLDCATRHGIPRDASVLETEPDCDCGHPRFRVERGHEFEVCLDRACESLDERVKAAFDREWECPNCDGDLRILRRGGLIAGCEHYPDCDTGWGLPAGTVSDDCACGLPVFETANGTRCLDADCSVDG
jgi:DNA topoisomerase-1